MTTACLWRQRDNADLEQHDTADCRLLALVMAGTELYLVYSERGTALVYGGGELMRV